MNKKKIDFSLGFKKYFFNTSWLMLERIASLAVSFLVGAYVARYLGPEDYGLRSYVVSFVGLFSVLLSLGLESILARELVKHKTMSNHLLGTTVVLQAAGVLVMFCFILISMYFMPHNSFTNLLIAITAFSYVFRIPYVIEQYFQAIVQSKHAVHVRLFQTIFTAIAKIVLVLIKGPLLYFVILMVVETFVLAGGLIVAYLRKGQRILNWKFDGQLAKRLIKDAWPLLFSAIFVTIYMKIDQVMIKNMLDNESLGNYAVAVRLSEMWYFIPMVITSSLFPAIINAKEKDAALYNERLRRLYSLMGWMAILIAVPLTFFSGKIVFLLFGSQYTQAAGVLKIHIWAGIFVFWGVASGKYLLSQNYTKIAFLGTFVGMISNVIMNLVLIPKYGIYGAAIATVISYFVATFFIIFIRKTREQAILMIKSLNLFYYLKFNKGCST